MCELKATKICDCLKKMAVKGAEGRVHSVFNSSANFWVNNQIITILNGDKTLSPFSVQIFNSIDFKSIYKVDDKINLQENAISTDKAIINIKKAKAINLKINFKNANCKKAMAASYVSLIEKSLISAPLAGEGIAPVLSKIYPDSSIDLAGNIWSDFLWSRIDELRVLLEKGDYASLKECLPKIAGSGPGLTPSSDDFIVGLIAAFYQGMLCGMLDKTKLCPILKEASFLAGEKTGDISKSFVVRAGEGIFSENILKLITSDINAIKINETQKIISDVINYGSTSGADTLAGYYFGVKILTSTH